MVCNETYYKNNRIVHYFSYFLTGITTKEIQAASKPVISSSQVKIKKNFCNVKKGSKIKLAANYGKKDINRKGT